MLKLLKYLKARDWCLIAVSILFIIAQVFWELRIPDYMREITNTLNMPNGEISQIWAAGGKMMLCALGTLVSAIVVGGIAAFVAASFSKTIRQQIFEKVDSFSMEEINQFSTASLITRSTNDVTQVQMMITMSLQLLVKAPLMAIMALLKISNAAGEWTLATAVGVLVMVSTISLLIVFVFPKFKIVQSLTDRLNNVTRENLTGIRVVRAYNAEAYQENKFDDVNTTLTKTHLFTSRLMSVMSPMMSVVMSGISLSIYWIGAYLINATMGVERVTLFGNMVVFSNYAMQVIGSFMMLTMIFILLPRASVSANRINQILDTKPSIVSGSKHIQETELKGDVVFDHVSFKYPDAEEYVLRDISFHVRQGETIAFIGSTGSGKSTLINLLPRFYDVSDGEIRLDGVPLPQYHLKDLYNRLGYVSQKAVLFKGTIQNNIAFGARNAAPASEEEIAQAAEIAQCKEFIAKTENGYQSSVAQGGTNFSGGQKQRLSIARAICRNPEVFIFDDSFSALDYKTDRILRTELRKRMKNKTTFIVAQRIGTIKDADQIVVLNEGEMVGIGTHDDLMKTCQVYQEIAFSQLSKEELGYGK